MSTFSIAATWSGSTPADQAGRAVASLEGLLPKDSVEQLDVALGAEEAVLHLKLTISPYPHALIQQVEREISRSGGRLLELWRLPKPERESFRSSHLANARKGGTLEAAAQQIRGHLARLAAAPRRSTVEQPAPGPFPAPRTPPPGHPMAPAPAPGVESAEEALPGEEDALADAFALELGAQEGAAAAEPLEPAPPPPTTRRAPRYAVLLEVEFRTELDFVREHATNISNGGLFIQTEHRPPVNSYVEVRVRLPNGERLQSRARVAHHVDAPGIGGVGVSFLNEDPGFRDALDRYLASLAGPG